MNATASATHPPIDVVTSDHVALLELRGVQPQQLLPDRARTRAAFMVRMVLRPERERSLVKTGALYFPATYPDAMQPGEYVSTGYATSIACVACGVVQPLLRVDLIHVCENPSCPATYWVELLSPTN